MDRPQNYLSSPLPNCQPLRMGRKLMRRFAISLALLSGLALAGCDTGPDTEAYARIEEGMSRDQVHELLGEPDETVGGTPPGQMGGVPDETASAPGPGNDPGQEHEGSYTELWYHGRQTVAVQYVGDEVTIKSIERVGSEHPATAQPEVGDQEPAEPRNVDESTERPSGTPPQREAPDAGDARKDDESPSAEFP